MRSPNVSPPPRDAGSGTATGFAIPPLSLRPGPTCRSEQPRLSLPPNGRQHLSIVPVESSLVKRSVPDQLLSPAPEQAPTTQRAALTTPRARTGSGDNPVAPWTGELGGSGGRPAGEVEESSQPLQTSGDQRNLPRLAEQVFQLVGFDPGGSPPARPTKREPRQVGVASVETPEPQNRTGPGQAVQHLDHRGPPSAREIVEGPTVEEEIEGTLHWKSEDVGDDSARVRPRPSLPPPEPCRSPQPRSRNPPPRNPARPRTPYRPPIHIRCRSLADPPCRSSPPLTPPKPPTQDAGPTPTGRPAGTSSRKTDGRSAPTSQEVIGQPPSHSVRRGRRKSVLPKPLGHSEDPHAQQPSFHYGRRTGGRPHPRNRRNDSFNRPGTAPSCATSSPPGSTPASARSGCSSTTAARRHGTPGPMGHAPRVSSPTDYSRGVSWRPLVPSVLSIPMREHSTQRRKRGFVGGVSPLPAANRDESWQFLRPMGFPQRASASVWGGGWGCGLGSVLSL